MTAFRMRLRLGPSFLRPLLVVAAAAALLSPQGLQPADAAGSQPHPSVVRDATVVAVIDSGLAPYHQDFLASRMPGDAALPLDDAPDSWLDGFPAPSTFASYFPLALTLSEDDDAVMADLHAADDAQWDAVHDSGTAGIHYRWIPGTKVVGALTFGPEEGDRPLERATASSGNIYGSGGNAHGMGSASAAVGNLHGTCPQCVLVFLQYTDQSSAERALTWANRQPWIDVVTNSYGFSATPETRDRAYNGTDVETGRAASERGQTTFFSAGNGLANAFMLPNSTLLSSQEGPDWIVTVAATDVYNNGNFSGTGKPADVAGAGYDYPSSFGARTTSDGGVFSGTSSATPQVAGTYARALWEARRELTGPSRAQDSGMVAVGTRTRCGKVRPGCELGDGRLTASELRTRLFEGAAPTRGGFSFFVGGLVKTPAIADARFASEGYGNYRGHLEEDFATQELQRVVGPILGSQAPPQRPDGEVEWFRVDSACRQHLWGSWTGGAYTDDSGTPLPEPDPQTWPTRTAIEVGCPFLRRPPEPIAH
jgi:hypothetical protein